MSDEQLAPPRLALVTGGCRRLGAAISARLAEGGWALALHARTDPTPDEALAAVLAEQATDWRGVTADLSDGAVAAGLVERVERAWGRSIDLVVNNAAPFAQDDWRTMTAESLMGQFASGAAAPLLIARALAVSGEAAGRPAACVMMLDQRIAHPHGEQASYTVAKLALTGAVRMLAIACAPHLRVNGVAPGLTLPTPDYSASQLRRLARRMPTGALPVPARVADAVAWLAEAGAVTGQVLFVDGGAHLESFEADFARLERD